MIKPNWDIFRAKFSENPRSNFEWFCFLLFCKEFDQPYGIFRYKNQSAIETSPIEKNDEVIAWQAKFYDTSLANHKNELLNTLDTAKRDYPEITKIIFYTNQEWGQTKGKKPQGLIEIENKSNELNVKLEWKAASFFESEFVTSKNMLFAKHFFTLETSIFSLLEQMEFHSVNILSLMNSQIKFNDGNIKIDRSKELCKLRDASCKVSILSGAGGIGKTAVIKDLHEELKGKVPFFVFKATEFELKNINDLYEGVSFFDFIEFHKNEEKKIIVIDSAEKLLDLKNHDPFKEFLSAIIKNGWQVIFTTRNNYLEDLNYQFFEIHRLTPLNIAINSISIQELHRIAEDNHFLLPMDEKLNDLIRNPFYLNEYLKFYENKENLDYIKFKAKLWGCNIKKSNPERERFFLKIAFERSKTGRFFLSQNDEQSVFYKEFVHDGILGYEEDVAGYFIAHDIYEEWALEKIIASEFIKKESNQAFFNKIGESLPIRRSFRNWLSEQLLFGKVNVITFIEEINENEEVKPFWRDEVLVSILLSDNAECFFDSFKGELLSKEFNLLKKITYILRVACKEVDDGFLSPFGIKGINVFSSGYTPTKPKGSGWKSFIKFIFNNKDVIGVESIYFSLPIIHDWNRQNKSGEITKLSSLIALCYYLLVTNKDICFSRDDSEKKLLQTILYGASEIKDELSDIIDKIIANKWNEHNSPFYKLSKMILTDLDSLNVYSTIPDQVLKLAELFWISSKKDDRQFQYQNLNASCHFGLDDDNLNYYPASAYQTPIYWMFLLNHQEKTIQFILNFMNIAIEKYFASNSDDSVHTVDVHISDEIINKQYISDGLWNLYRGTGSPVSPNLLQSIHMALEKHLLEFGKNTDANALDNLLVDILSKSKSASITAIVASVVLAYPRKTFNTAKILFKTKEFIIHDTSRTVKEQSALFLYSIGKNMGFAINKLYVEERIKTCEEKHRKLCLEDIFIHYQFLKEEGSNGGQLKKDLWKILDKYYMDLQNNEGEFTDEDKTWRLFLARMDLRKMDVSTENNGNKVVIKLEPKIEPDIKKHSDDAQKQNSELMKFHPLRQWAELKLKNDSKLDKYKKYEDEPSIAIKDVKEILEKITSIKNDGKKYDEGNFLTLNYYTPAFVCSALVEKNINDLSEDDKVFCKDIILNAARSTLQPDYQYQMSDASQPAFSALSRLLKFFPNESPIIKVILLIGLFKESHVGGFLSTEKFNIFPIMSIQKLWTDNFNDAQSLLLGYLLLKPKYDDLRRKIRDENHKKGLYNSRDEHLLNRFINDCGNELASVINNELSLSNLDLNNARDNNLSMLVTAFCMIPNATEFKDHKDVAKVAIDVFAKNVTLSKRGKDIDFQLKDDFLKKYSRFVLSLPESEVTEYIKPFVDAFNGSEFFADFFESFIFAEDALNKYDNFWLIWNEFKSKIYSLCKNGDSLRFVDKIVKSYIFATVEWKAEAKEWHSFKDNNRRFFSDLSSNIGHCPSFLYSITKLLTGVGSNYADNGITWVSHVIKNNHSLAENTLDANTVFYLEKYVRGYVFNNREKIKKTNELKRNLILILELLIKKESVVGYMLREVIM